MESTKRLIQVLRMIFEFLLTAMTPYNRLYVPYTVANGLKGAEFAQEQSTVLSSMDDPVNIDSFVTRAQEEKVRLISTYSH
ncbi:hypothetical protein KHA80_21435 [Anaerobacillus sp. HL2]|nr:hypothetical protein KHA80_21435 [Anaerobacillus sp. HL2]